MKNFCLKRISVEKRQTGSAFFVRRLQLETNRNHLQQSFEKESEPLKSARKYGETGVAGDFQNPHQQPLTHSVAER